MGEIPFWDDHTEGYEGPLTSDDPWDLVILGNERLPGVCTSFDGSPTQKIDVQKANGSDGGALVERGIVPARVEFEILIWTPAQWNEFQRIKQRILRQAGKIDVADQKKVASAAQVDVTKKSALSISHPAARDARISSVLIESISPPRPGPHPGTRVVRFKCLQFIAPTPAKATRKAQGVKPVPIANQLRSGKNVPVKPSTTDAGPNGPPTPPTIQGTS